jgi:salicylate hydroxylase
VIGADGLHSVARTALNGITAPFFTRQVAWRALIPNRTGRGPEVRVHMGPLRHVVSYPLREGSLLNLVAVQERAAWTSESWSQTDDPQALRAAFADFGGEVPEMLAAVGTVHLWGLFRHPVARVWQRGGVVILGDAARYQARREGRARRVVEAASRNAWKYHLSFPPLRWAAHTALRAGGALAPERMIRQFDWIYAHDVTRGAA